MGGIEKGGGPVRRWVKSSLIFGEIPNNGEKFGEGCQKRHMLVVRQEDWDLILPASQERGRKSIETC